MASSAVWPKIQPNHGFGAHRAQNGVWGRQNSSNWSEIVHSTPHVGSPAMRLHRQPGAKIRVQGCVWAILRETTKAGVLYLGKVPSDFGAPLAHSPLSGPMGPFCAVIR